MNKPVSSKLFKLKKWLTLPEAVKYLSGVCGEEVTEADILRLALDGHLKLSVNFVNHAQARCGKIVGYDDVEWGSFPDMPQNLRNTQENPSRYIKSLYIGGERFLNLSNEMTTLYGVWDLAMIGNERLDVEHQYQNLTGGPDVTLQGLDGAFVEGRDGVVYQLRASYDDNEYRGESVEMLEKFLMAGDIIDVEKGDYNRSKEERKKHLDMRVARPKFEDYYPATGLPEDSVLVIRTEALKDFEQLIGDGIQNSNSHYHANQSKNLLLLIAASEKFWKNIDIKERWLHPSNEEVSKWLIDQGLSKQLAEAGAILIRPESAIASN